MSLSLSADALDTPEKIKIFDDLCGHLEIQIVLRYVFLPGETGC